MSTETSCYLFGREDLLKALSDHARTFLMPEQCDQLQIAVLAFIDGREAANAGLAWAGFYLFTRSQLMSALASHTAASRAEGELSEEQIGRRTFFVLDFIDSATATTALVFTPSLIGTDAE